MLLYLQTKGDLAPNLSAHAQACYLADNAAGNPTK